MQFYLHSQTPGEKTRLEQNGHGSCGDSVDIISSFSELRIVSTRNTLRPIGTNPIVFKEQSRTMPKKPKLVLKPRVTISESATAADVQIILQLYDLRRDAEMRRARHFISAEFWPESPEDTLRIARAYPSPENTWLRQVTSYWEMASAFVLRGGLHEGLFFDISGEMYCVYAKFKPFLDEIRRKLPYFLVGVEKVIMNSREGRARLERLERRLARRKQKLAQAAALAGTSAGFN